MAIYGNFDGNIIQVPFWDIPGRSVDQLLLLPSGPKCPIFGPKIGPKWPKLLFYCYITYISVQGVILTYFLVLSASVVFIFIDFP